jgi:hypothetical protein
MRDEDDNVATTQMVDVTNMMGALKADMAADALREELGLLLPEELAAAIGITVNTLAQWRAQKTGPVPTLLGKRVFYHVRDVEKWVEESKRPHRLIVKLAA